MKITSLQLSIFIVTLYTISTVAYASQSVGTILSTSHSAKVCHDDACTSYGTINFLPSGTQAPVTITDTAITGYAWGDEMGWINFAPTGAGITVNPTTGELSGTAWSQTSGWINFRPANSGTLSDGVPIGVSITSDGYFYGWAWNGGTYGGWIKFDCASASTCVKTDWKTTSWRTHTTVLGGGGQLVSPVQPAAQQLPILQEQVSSPSVGTPAPVVISSPVAFITKKLSQGMTSPEIMKLQTILAEDKELYPLGLVSGYFGQATKRAVEAFQIKYEIVGKGEEGYGDVGPKTRAKINELAQLTSGNTTKNSTQDKPTQNVISEVSSLLLLTKSLRQGMTDEQVKILQTVLSQDKEVYPLGKISGYYGPATTKAVKVFQIKYSIVREGGEGYGDVGPKTRVKVNELLKEAN